MVMGSPWSGALLGMLTGLFLALIPDEKIPGEQETTSESDLDKSEDQP